MHDAFQMSCQDIPTAATVELKDKHSVILYTFYCQQIP